MKSALKYWASSTYILNLEGHIRLNCFLTKKSGAATTQNCWNYFAKLSICALTVEFSLNAQPRSLILNLLLCLRSLDPLQFREESNKRVGSFKDICQNCDFTEFFKALTHTLFCKWKQARYFYVRLLGT